MPAPAGFVTVERGEVRALLLDDLAADIEAAGLLEPWRVVVPRPPGPGTGRGPRAVVRLRDGGRVLVKAYLRGGLLARVNRERYFATRRFVEELRVGRLARARGVPVGEAVGVVLRAAHPGVRAWGIVRHLDDGADLARLLAAQPPRERVLALWAAARASISLAYDAGLEHADLNLGNIVVREEERAPRAYLVDLDSARWHEGGVPEDARARVDARLARSWRKILGGDPPATSA